jgi:Domain of Unknown Function (DUF748)
MSRRLPLRKLLAWVGLSLVAIALAVAVLSFAFGHAILNRYAKEKTERAFAGAYPGCTLRIGELDYALAANCLVARSISVRAPNTTLKTGPISLTGVRWVRLIRGSAALADLLTDATIDATNLDVDFPLAHYGIRCARLRASVPSSELVAEESEFRTSVGDEVFFAAHDFRTTRFHLIVPECRVLGLAYRDLLQGKSYRAASIHLSRPSFEALVNCDKPLLPFVKSPLMVNEALAAIPQPLRIDSLSITNGDLRYGEREAPAAGPGVLTFSAVSLSVEGIANRGQATAAMRLRARGHFMNTATMTLLMTIPVSPSDSSLHYSGSLGPMDLTLLNAFLDPTEHTRVKSGTVHEAAFDIDVTAGQARGLVRAIYNDLEIAVLDKQTGSEKGLENRLASLLANKLKIRNSNTPDASGSVKLGEVNYTRAAKDEFLQFAWFALRTGVLDVISH